MIKRLFNIFFSRSFFLYLIFGGLATLIDWSSFALATYSAGLSYLISVIISFSLGSITNFYLNKRLNFKNEYKKWYYQFIVYLIIALLGLSITLVLMWLLVDNLFIEKMFARIITTAIVLIYNFLGHKYITFRILK